MSNRYTVKDLRAAIAEINAQMPGGLKIREQGRNGYQAADMYNAAGACLRNIGCGTAREVAGYCWDALRAEQATATRTREARALDLLERCADALEDYAAQNDQGSPAARDARALLAEVGR